MAKSTKEDLPQHIVYQNKLRRKGRMMVTCWMEEKDFKLLIKLADRYPKPFQRAQALGRGLRLLDKYTKGEITK